MLTYIVCMSVPVSQFIPHFSSLLGIHTFILYIFVSISALSINSSVPFFLDSTYKWCYMIFVFLFLSLRSGLFKSTPKSLMHSVCLLRIKKMGLWKPKCPGKNTVSLLKSRAVRLTNLFSQAPFLERTAVRTLSWQAKVRTAMSEDRVIHKKSR